METLAHYHICMKLGRGTKFSGIFCDLRSIQHSRCPHASSYLRVYPYSQTQLFLFSLIDHPRPNLSLPSSFLRVLAYTYPPSFIMVSR